MTNSFISQVRACLFAREVFDASNAEMQRSATPMQTLSDDDLRQIAGGDVAVVDGSPKGSW